MNIPSLYSHKIHSLIINALPPISHGIAALIPAIWMSAFGDFTLSIEFVICAFVIGNLPDIDTAQSRIGRLCKPLANYLYQHHGHRTITHSIFATLLVGSVAYVFAIFGLEPWDWWWWMAWYFSHIFLDMIVGGRAGVTLIWPAPTQFYVIDLPSGGTGEKIVTAALIIGATWPALWGIPSPSDWVRQATGNLDYAITDYRKWETGYTLYADVEGTWQETRQAINGRYEIERVVGNTLHLKIGNQIVEAGQAQQPIYVRHIVVERGPLRHATTRADPTPTPVIVITKIDNVANVDNEIIVKIGDEVKRGDLLAYLDAHRREIQILPTATPQPEPTPGIDQLAINGANARLQMAIVQATAVAEAAQPDPHTLLVAQANLGIKERNLQQAQASYDAVSWNPEIAMMPQSLRLEQATNQHAIAAAQAAAAARVDRAAITAAQARLQVAYTDYNRAIATPTAAYQPPADQNDLSRENNSVANRTVIHSMVSGIVTDVRIASVTGNRARIEIAIQTSAVAAPIPTPISASESQQAAQQQAPGTAVPADAMAAVVISVADGDTITVDMASGATGKIRVEKIRLLDVDTPETVHPSKPIQCFGPEASAHTKARLAKGSTVYIESAGRDKYDRLLGYVWTNDGRLYNQELVENGLAIHNSYGKLQKHTITIASAERNAKANGVGLWTACDQLAMNQ